MCIVNGTDKYIEHHHNYGRVKPSLLLPSNPSVGYSNMSVSLVDGLLTCSFERLARMPEVRDYYDLNNEYYLLFAYGAIHDSNK